MDLEAKNGADNRSRVREMVDDRRRGALRAPLDLGWRALGERPYGGEPARLPEAGKRFWLDLCYSAIRAARAI